MSPPLFQHRQYKWIAAFFAERHMYNAPEDEQLSNLADALAETNPKFDRGRFLKAAQGAPLPRDAR